MSRVSVKKRQISIAPGSRTKFFNCRLTLYPDRWKPDRGAPQCPSEQTSGRRPDLTEDLSF